MDPQLCSQMPPEACHSSALGKRGSYDSVSTLTVFFCECLYLPVREGHKGDVFQ